MDSDGFSPLLLFSVQKVLGATVTIAGSRDYKGYKVTEEWED